jgi:hypothetical protein
MRRLHRGLGALGALFLLWMALSGIAINHSDALGLSARYASSPVLLDWYGVNGPAQLTSFRAGDDWLSFAGSTAYFNGEAVTTLDGGHGAIRAASMIVAAGSRELLLLDHQGRLVERLPWEMAGEIEAIGENNGAIVVRAADRSWQADGLLLVWQPLDVPAAEIRWSFPESAPAKVHDMVVAAYRGNVLSLQRLLLDMHSGRILGNNGVWVYDLLALIVCLLAGSGLVLWLRNGARKTRKKRR